MATTDQDYKKRHQFGFNRPVEFNHEGKKLKLVQEEQTCKIRPFGRNSPVVAIVTVQSIDELNETITVSDSLTQLTMSFDDWAWMNY